MAKVWANLESRLLLFDVALVSRRGDLMISVRGFIVASDLTRKLDASQDPDIFAPLMITCN